METISPTHQHHLASPHATLDSMADDSAYLKMEDLNTSASPAPSSYDDRTAIDESSPPPVVVQSKPAKKRKSWGQELPEPKTALPPRKRAKTDDEKEQRRIERIKRNRAAAHNSRERKRQEAENLAVLLAKANAELDAYKKLHGPLPAHIVLPEVKLSSDNLIESAQAHTSTTTNVGTPAPSLVESHGSVQENPSSPASPEDIFNSAGSPHIKQEPFETSAFPSGLPTFENLESKPSALSSLDLTQHSAAMLCDLQCRSSNESRSSTSATSTWWSNFLLCLMTLQIQTCYRTLLVAIWTLSPSRMARLMQASATRSTSRSTTSSTTLRISRSTPGRLARHKAATGLGAPREDVSSMNRSATISERTTGQAQAHQTRTVLSESRVTTTMGSEDQAMGDDGDENHGVRRGRSLDLGDLE